MNYLDKLLHDLEVVARGLGELLADSVFVGGSTVPLYLASPETEELRVTEDIDIVIQVSSLVSYAKLEERLVEKGFRHDLVSKVAIRKKYKGLVVDIMPSDPNVWGFANKWYEHGRETSQIHLLPQGTEIRIFKLPYFLAAKFEAHKNRAESLDLSDDLEDIFLILQGAKDFDSTLLGGSEQVKSYLRQEFKKLLSLSELELRRLCDCYRVSYETLVDRLSKTVF